MYASTLPRSNWLRRASIRLAWYRHMPASSIVLFSQTRLQVRFSVKSWRSSLRAHFNSGPSLFWGNHGQPHEIITTPDRNLPETPPPPHLTITLTLSLTLSPLMRRVLRGGDYWPGFVRAPFIRCGRQVRRKVGQCIGALREVHRLSH